MQTRHLAGSGQWTLTALTLLGVVAVWIAIALSYAVLAQPTDTLTVLNVRGARGVPTLVWVGSRDLVRLVGVGATDDASYDR